LNLERPFPALTSPTGYLFVITYPYSGAGKIIEHINSHDGFDILGHICDSLLSLAETHASLRPYGLAGARSHTLRHEALGWAFADSFAANILRATPDSGVIGATLSYWGHDREKLLSGLLFLYSFFPNVRFVFITRNAQELVGRRKSDALNEAALTRRVQHLDRTFALFQKSFPELCYVQSFNQFRVEKAQAKFDNFLGDFAPPQSVSPDPGPDHLAMLRKTDNA
jgi:hypothetical protein